MCPPGRPRPPRGRGPPRPPKPVSCPRSRAERGDERTHLRGGFNSGAHAIIDLHEAIDDTTGNPAREQPVQPSGRRPAGEALRESRAKLTRELEGTRKLQKISSLLIEDESGEGLYDQILDAAMSIMRSDFSSIQMLDSEKGELELIGWRNFHPDSAAYWRKVSSTSATICGSALHHGARIVLPDVGEAESLLNAENLRHFRLNGIAGVQSTPLTTRDGRLIGMMSTHWRHRHEPNERELALFDVLARQTADVLERRRSNQEMRSNELWLADQNEAFRASLNGAPLEESLGVLVRSAKAHLGDRSRCAFYLADRDGKGLHHVVGMTDSYAQAVDGFPIAADSLSCGLAVHTGQAVITADVSRSPLWASWRWMADEHHYRSTWSFPIETSSGKVVGTFATYFDSPREATARDHEYAAVVTRTAAIIIARSQEAEERSRAEQALRRSEEKYRTLFDSIDEGLAIVELIRDPNGLPVDVLFVDVNPVFERQTGLAEVRGKLRSATGAATDAAWLETLDRVARGGEPVRLERFDRELGRWYRAYVSRVAGEDRNQVAIVFEDISERKNRERNHALLVEVTAELVGLETIPDSMQRLGERIARHFGASWCMFVELSADLESTVGGYGWHAPETAALDGPYRMRDFLSAEQLAAHLLGETVVLDDVRSDPRVNGPSFAALGIGAVMLVPLVRDRICRFQLSIIDRQPRRWRQDEIELIEELTQRLWTRLERARAEEALRRSEARLRVVAAELEEADRRKNQFLAMLGHELRNPLAAIRGGVALVRSEKARPESRAAALPIVADQVSHMERLVDDLLDLTRVVQGSVQVRREPMALQDALHQAIEMVRPQAEAGAFEIGLEVDSLPLDLLGDRVRLTQVFMNVIGNAIKYSGDARRIEVGARRQGALAEVRVRDFGVGIPAELLPRIFEPFVQATPGVTLQAGLGLGLAVVRQLVRLHDGEVETFSDGPGRGSEFVLRFPLAGSAA